MNDKFLDLLLDSFKEFGINAEIKDNQLFIDGELFAAANNKKELIDKIQTMGEP